MPQKKNRMLVKTFEIQLPKFTFDLFTEKAKERNLTESQIIGNLIIGLVIKRKRK